MVQTDSVYKLIRECLETGSTDLGSYKADENDVDAIDWNEVYEEMKAQAIDAMPQKWLLTHSLPDEALRNRWIRTSVIAQGRWIQIMKGQDSLLRLLDSYNIDCVILKGAAAAMSYPQPTLRRCGDVDFLVRQEDYDRAAQVMEKNGYELAHDKDPQVHHYGYIKDGISYELHRRLAIIREDNRELIEFFEDGINRREYVQTEGFSFPVLPTELNGLVLMFHINQHLRSGLGLRHIIDWMMYLNKNDNLQKIMPVLEQTGMSKLALTVTMACQKYLGLRKMVEDSEQCPVDAFMDYIWEKGNFGRKSGGKDKIASYITDVSSNPIRLYKRLQLGGQFRWKATRRYPLLRPFAWIYQIGAILNELIRKRVTPSVMIEQKNISDNRKEFIRKLGLGIDPKI